MNSNIRNNIMYIFVLVISVLFIIIGYNLCKPEIFNNYEGEFYTAKVVDVVETKYDEFSLDDGKSTIQNKNISFTAKLTGTKDKDNIINVMQYIDYMYAVQPKEVMPGDKIIVSNVLDPDTEEYKWQFIEHNRSDYLIWLCVLFFALIVIIGRRKGISTIISLVLTTLIIFVVYVPSILKGYNVYLSTIVISIYIIFMSIYIINGANKKTLCAIIGNVGGVLIAGMLALLMNNLLNITGVIEEDYVFLMYLETSSPIDLRAIVWGSIVIGSLGAIMDVAMSIASSMHELSETMENKSFNNMLKSGMNIGRDAIGTMTNTLILAYIGGSLATVLLLIAYNKNVLYLFNMEMIVVEVIQAIVGSIGILFAVPVTAAFSAYIFNKEKSKKAM